MRPEVVAGATTGRAVAELIRPETARLPAALHVAAGASAGVDASTIAAGVVLVFAAYGAAAAYNDLHDVDVDRANGRLDRPLVAGTATAATARATVAACLVVVVAVQPWLVQPAGIAVTIGAAALALAYSHPRLAVARRGLGATVLLAWCYAALPVLLAGRAGGGLVTLVLLGASQVLHKDARDEAGDRRHGKRTPIVRYGAPAVERLSIGACLVGTAVGTATVGAGGWTAAAAGAAATERRRVRRWLLLAAMVGVAARA